MIRPRNYSNHVNPKAGSRQQSFGDKVKFLMLCGGIALFSILVFVAKSIGLTGF